MRVCLLSSYLPQRCGIAAYTAALCRGFLAGKSVRDVVVLAEQGAAGGHVDGVHSVPAFRRTDDYAVSLAARATAMGADVVHVQHSSDLFGFDERLPRLLTLLRGRGIRSVVTLHSVHSPLTAALERKRGVARFHRRVGDVADAMVVHGRRGMKDELVRQGVPTSKIHVIPHGTELISSPSGPDARRRLGLDPRGPLLLYFGFVHPQKSVHTALFAMRRVARLIPEARLCVAGSVQNATRVNRAYAAWLDWLAGRPALSGRVVIRDTFSSVEETHALFRAADVVLLPYWEAYGSASGVAHQAVGAGRPVLVSRSPKFAELAEAFGPEIVVTSAAPSAWANAILRLYQDAPLRERLTERARCYACETSWPNVAERHAVLYRDVIGNAVSSPAGHRSWADPAHPNAPRATPEEPRSSGVLPDV
jgi:glycosyltransferase involved in cell wall biosynthesis